jgi:hypothetical protein
MNSDGGNRTRLTNDSLIDCMPSWSPDGTKITFMSGPVSLFDLNSFEIYVIDASGGNRTRLTNNTVGDGQPSYSPDGKNILFASGNVMSPTGIEIYVMNADGSNRIRLTNNSVTDGFPAWSADGSKIIYATGNIGDETTVEFYGMNVDGSTQTRLTNNSSLEWFPDWQPTPARQVQFGSTSYNVGEAGPAARVTVTRTGDTTTGATVDYLTNDTAGFSACNGLNGVASSRCDYVPAIGTLRFVANETSKTIDITIVDDSYAEGTESFVVTLINPSGATLGSPSAASISITDNESVNGADPIDTVEFFVRQHYLDFLNREPDASGLAFWSNNINGCTPLPSCTEVTRINTSAAFFLSIEFQETGYLVERIYKVAYGDGSGLSTLGGTHQTPVPIIRFNEFLPDTQRIGQGVVVGQGNWQQQIENNKVAYTNEFVQRPRFLTAYPPTLTAGQFVDGLNARANGVLSPAQRDQLVSELSAGTKTRAQVLRAIAENQTLYNAGLNRAFVLMQYFGYLRRNPNDPQDTDYTGYDFWLTKLNQFGGNFVNAEMVKSFIASAEYRGRFGP